MPCSTKPADLKVSDQRHLPGPPGLTPELVMATPSFIDNSSLMNTFAGSERMCRVGERQAGVAARTMKMPSCYNYAIYKQRSSS